MDGDVSELIDGTNVYSIGDKLGLSRDEIYRYAISLGKRGLLKTWTFKPKQIALVQLTIDGADFVIFSR